MKITIEHLDLKVTVEDFNAETIAEVMPLIKQALLGIGFHYQTVKDYIPDE